ncbi:MAG: hypothetical protein DYG90_00790 [Chloroflexi bacterium CFX6]|nr:hypothetical protein [Chloroflexi bacterium CFX6]
MSTAAPTATSTPETAAHALVGPDGQPLAVLFTGPGRTALAEAWAAEVYAHREEIKARAATKAEQRAAKRGSGAKAKRRPPSDQAGDAWMERLP